MKHPIFPLFFLLLASLMHTTHTQHDHDLTTEKCEFLDDQVPFRKPKGYLSVDYLNVTTALTVKGQQVIGNSQSGAGFAASYGQLEVDSQRITFSAPNTDAVIPFNLTGPSSNMDVSTDEPATITVQNSGIYQISASLLITVEESSEHPFDETIYTLMLNINGSSEAVSAVYASQAGTFSLNCSTIASLSVNDDVQFYMQASVLGAGEASSNIVNIGGNAYLMQIAE